MPPWLLLRSVETPWRGSPSLPHRFWHWRRLQHSRGTTISGIDPRRGPSQRVPRGRGGVVEKQWMVDERDAENDVVPTKPSLAFAHQCEPRNRAIERHAPTRVRHQPPSTKRFTTYDAGCRVEEITISRERAKRAPVLQERGGASSQSGPSAEVLMQ